MPPATHTLCSAQRVAHAARAQVQKRMRRKKTHHLSGADGGAALSGGALQRKRRQSCNHECAHDGHDE